MIKPSAYRKAYRTVKMMERHKELMPSIMMFKEVVKDMKFFDKIYVLWNILF